MHHTLHRYSAIEIFMALSALQSLMGAIADAFGCLVLFVVRGNLKALLPLFFIAIVSSVIIIVDIAAVVVVLIGCGNGVVVHYSSFKEIEMCIVRRNSRKICKSFLQLLWKTIQTHTHTNVCICCVYLCIFTHDFCFVVAHNFIRSCLLKLIYTHVHTKACINKYIYAQYEIRRAAFFANRHQYIHCISLIICAHACILNITLYL